jgi:formylglycine-generating enzyme required for sulfatase activity
LTTAWSTPNVVSATGTRSRDAAPATALRLVVATLAVATALVAFADDPQEVSAPPWVRHPDKPFSISATEVTVAQFRACVEAGQCNLAATNAQCNYGKTDKDEHPLNCVTYAGAEQFCTYAGGRICTEAEWLDACSGTDGRAYPYGPTFDPATCNAQSQSVVVEGRERATAPVGSHTLCEGGLPGLFDMAGNVAEWVNSCNGDYCKFRGAGYLSNDPVDRFAGCSGICSGNDKGFQSGIVGFRCCQDATN